MRRWLALLPVIPLVAALHAGVAVAQEPPPAVFTDHNGVAPGDGLVVTGSGFGPDTQLSVALCGRGGRFGSSDCDVANARIVVTRSDGTFGTPFVAGRPPVDCPCVIKATDQATGDDVTTALAIQGMPTRRIPKRNPALPKRAIDVDIVELRTEGQWSAWFGGSPRRTLVVDVRNTGTVPLYDPRLTVLVGKGENPTGLVRVPELGQVEPGMTRRVEVPLELGVLAYGGYSVVAELPGMAKGGRVATHTTSWPWGVIVLTVLFVQLLLVRARNRARRRIDREVDRTLAAEEDPVVRPPPMAPDSEQPLPLRLRSPVGVLTAGPARAAVLALPPGSPREAIPLGAGGSDDDRPPIPLGPAESDDLSWWDDEVWLEPERPDT